jgi:hypothetical protein
MLTRKSLIALAIFTLVMFGVTAAGATTTTACGRWWPT